MDHQEILCDALYTKLNQALNSTSGKSILLRQFITAIEEMNEDMPAFLQSPKGQNAFYDAVTKLVLEKIISPIGKRTNAYQGLHQKYRINSDPQKNNDTLMTHIIRNIVLPASVDYYIKNPTDYIHDREVIEILLNALMRRDKDLVTVNERAYQLFGDEKFFRGDDKSRSRGEVVLKRLGLCYADIGCEEMPEPFFYFLKKDFSLRRGRIIFIIENKDTFWSFKKNIMDVPSNLQMDMLVYGEGKKIISSFQFMDGFEIVPEQDTLFYFGDLDPEGISIFCHLQSKYYQYRIFPFVEGYQALVKIGLGRELMKVPKQQKTSEKHIERFIKYFEAGCMHEMKKILDEGFYIPQEALSATLIKDTFGVNHDENKS